MHMSDALLSPSVGVTFLAAGGLALSYSSRQLTRHPQHEQYIPLMGVLGAFVFAAQMINFTIPGTGASGHLAGGLFLAILLRPYAGFLTMATILFLQAVLFADGGLLALGTNLFNLGFVPCFLIYPLYQICVDKFPHRQAAITILAGILSLQLGAYGVVLQTKSSGMTDLSWSAFLGAMIPIHLAIGVVEGFVTASLVAFLVHARPELSLHHPETAFPPISLPAATMTPSELPPMPAMTAPPVTIRKSILQPRLSWTWTFATLLIFAGMCAGLISWFASENPDGLEWSLQKVTGQEEMGNPSTSLHQNLENIQQTTSIFSDYSFSYPQTNHYISTSISGLSGSLATLLVALGLGWILKPR